MSLDDRTILTDKSKIAGSSILANRAVLIILSSNMLGKSFIIDKPNTLIGRHESCDIIINDPLVSKEHCKISTDELNKFYIEDLGSSNSTFLNGKELKKKTHIIYGDRIIIGDTIMRFYLEETLEKR